MSDGDMRVGLGIDDMGWSSYSWDDLRPNGYGSEWWALLDEPSVDERREPFESFLGPWFTFDDLGAVNDSNPDLLAKMLGFMDMNEMRGSLESGS